MHKVRGESTAFGQPGNEPRWAHANKEGVGTAYSANSRIWFTLWNGILTEVYSPTVDRPQLRDLQYLITDGKSFLHEEARDLQSTVERLSHHDLGYRVVNSDPEGRYIIIKEIICHPHLPCVLQHTRIEGNEEFLTGLKLYVLCAPHLEMGGSGNNAYVIEVGGREVLAAEKKGRWLALEATVPFARASCGYVGRSDGRTDLADNFQMDWEFDQALDGNVALMGEIALKKQREFTLSLSLSDCPHGVVTGLFQSLSTPFKVHRKKYIQQWDGPCKKILPLEKLSGDGGNLYHASYSLLLAHEDKTYPGAVIASLSIPWGEAKGDADAGYHLVWVRDMSNNVSALLAAGNTETPLRALIYLAASQQEDGGFPQNFWVTGQPYSNGIQLDEVAFAIMLAWRLSRANALQDFDPYTMVTRAASYLINSGPVTPQERWEEASGYSPSTLASTIAALICAACIAREREDEVTARFLEEHADFLECHIEDWTVATEGTVIPEIKRHFIRILPVDTDETRPDERPNSAVLNIGNRTPDGVLKVPAKEVVDAGFLELVRYGIRKPDNPLIVDSLRVIDYALKVNTPSGPCWRRYSHDGYGQRDDGGPFVNWGKGRAWPLLTGERGHYELAAGNDFKFLIRAMESFASPTGLLPEQIWDEPDRPDIHMYLGRPTGAAMPLLWAHAEYIKLLRSAFDGEVFDLIPEVVERYRARKSYKCLEVWQPNRQARTVKAGTMLRIVAPTSFGLRWSSDEWQTVEQSSSSPAISKTEFVDIPVPANQQAPIRFTFFRAASGRSDEREYEVTIQR
jgi:glucoamylase